jgi:hypothetical protein
VVSHRAGDEVVDRIGGRGLGHRLALRRKLSPQS